MAKKKTRKKKMNKLVDELVVVGKVTKKEGEKFLKEIWRETRDERELLREGVEKIGKDLRKKIDIPTRKEFEALKKRVEALEKKETE